MAGLVNTRSNIKNRANIGVGIRSPKQDVAMKLLPNPAEKFVQIEFIGNGSNTTLNIYDKLGRCQLNQVFENVSGKKTIQIDLEAFTSGIYSVNLNNSLKIETQKLIVR